MIIFTRFFWLTGCLAVVVILQARASTIRHDLAAQPYRDEAAFYPMVGSVTGGVFNRSGVLISNRWVLTAGHVADSKIGGNFRIVRCFPPPMIWVCSISPRR